MSRLEGKVAIITGAAQGQGAAHVRRFLNEGASVLATDIDAAKGEASVKELGSGQVAFAAQDVRLLADWEKVVEVAVKTFGDITVLVNNAAIDLQRSLVETTEDEYRRIIDVNQVSVFLGMKAVVPSMKRAGGGSIVNISSIVGTHAVSPLRTAYVASKFAITGMTKVAAIELGEFGIRVNSVQPGFVNTPMLAAATNTERMKQIPLRRAAEPDDISQLVAFLASDESSYITGTEHLIDGGLARGF